MNLIYTTGAGEANYTASSEVCELCNNFAVEKTTTTTTKKELCESFYHQVLEMFGFHIITE